MRARRKDSVPSSSRPRQTGELNIFADPSDTSPRKSDTRRVRRNSDSSVVSRNSRLLDPEEEKRRQERRRRERRHRDRREGKKPDRKLDIIDKLDVTSIYGTGCKSSELDFSHSLLIWEQYSITMDPLMHAIPIETVQGVGVHLCKPSQKTLSTMF